MGVVKHNLPSDRRIKVKETLIWALVSFMLYVAAAIVSVPKVASLLGWPAWIVFFAVFFDTLLVSVIPITFPAYVSRVAFLNRPRPEKRMPGHFSSGLGCLLILTTVVAPIIAFVWVLVVIVVP
jgi:hypothetical protein